MVGVLLGRHGIDEVGVKEEVIHIEVLVRVDNGGLIVGSGHDPSVASPGVGDLLIPAVVELEASPVMVAQNTEPGLVGEASPLIYTFEDLIELVLRRVRDLIHRTPTSLLDTAPVEVIPNVEDILWVNERSPGFKGVGHQQLWLVVYACHVATLWCAWRLSAGVKALHKLLMVAELHRVLLIPATPRKDAGPGPAPPIVSDDGLPALRWVQGTVHATPVSDCKDVHLLGAMDHRGWPVLTFVGALRTLAQKRLTF